MGWVCHERRSELLYLYKIITKKVKFQGWRGAYYKREVIMFDSKENEKRIKNWVPLTKVKMVRLEPGVVIATGSTDPNKKSFELTEEGANIDFVKNNEEKIQKNSSNQVRDIKVKDEN